MNLNSVTLRSIAVAIALLMATALPCASQKAQQMLRTSPREVFAEAHLVPADSGMVRMMACLRWYTGVLSFTKQPNSAGYRADFSITLECTDSAGVIRNSVTRIDSIVVESFAETRSATAVIRRIVSCTVPLSVYKATALIEQNGGTIARWTSQDLTITTTKRRAVLTPPLLCSSLPVTPETRSESMVLNPLCYGTKVEFCDRDATFVTHASGVAEDEQWVWTCTRVAKENLLIPGSVPSLGGTCTVLLDRGVVDISRATDATSTAEPSFSGGTLSALRVIPDNSHLGVALICANVPTSLLSPGAYRYVVSCPATGDSVVREFQCFWPSMPQSFQLEAQMLLMMRYLLTGDDYEDMADGSEAEVRRRCFDWWKKFDPNPATPYNQAMAACFTRADEAASTYKSAMEPNGIRTERGRVYILYGPPDAIRTDRVSAEIQRETWSYISRLKRKVIFEINERGVYSIVKVEDL